MWSLLTPLFCLATWSVYTDAATLGSVQLSLQSRAPTRVVEIQTLTGPSPADKMDGPMVHAELRTSDGRRCLIEALDDTRRNDYELRAVDYFRGEFLKDCRDFEASSATLSTLTLFHRSDDSWRPEWARVLFSDGTFSDCPAGRRPLHGRNGEFDEMELKCQRPQDEAVAVAAADEEGKGDCGRGHRQPTAINVNISFQ